MKVTESARPHFFKCHSRLGMVNLPNGGTELNLGVEDGPDAVLSRTFLGRFGRAKVEEFNFPLPEEIKKSTYLKVMALSSKKMADLINLKLVEDETQVVVGGDHSVAFGALMAVLQRVKADRVGYIQFDSHGDVHLHRTSPSGNFHGMWLRPFLDEFDVPAIAEVSPDRLKPGQLMFVGNLELEPEEETVFKDKQIEVINSADITNDKNLAVDRMAKFTKRYEHVHISFDIDTFERGTASATGTPAENGLAPGDVWTMLEVLRPLTQKSIDLVEVNPTKPNPELTIKTARKVLLALI